MTSPASAPVRILVVDDDLQVAALLEIYLSGLGYEVRCASHGVQALEVVPVFEPDLVLLDLHMPGMSGHEVLARLHQERPELPVVLITGDEQLARRTLRSSTVGLVIKPFSLDAMSQAVAAALRRRIA